MLGVSDESKGYCPFDLRQIISKDVVFEEEKKLRLRMKL